MQHILLEPKKKTATKLRWLELELLCERFTIRGVAHASLSPLHPYLRRRGSNRSMCVQYMPAPALD